MLQHLLRIGTAIIRGQMSGYYAVRNGRNPGIYRSWDECQEQVHKFSRAKFKKFNTKEEAWQFMSGEQSVPVHVTTTSRSSPAGPSYTPSSYTPSSYSPSSYTPSSYTPSYFGRSSYSSRGSFEATPPPLPFVQKRPLSPDPDTDSDDDDYFHHQTPKRSRSATDSMGKVTYQDGAAMVYTDGCCTDNGFHGARAGIGVYWGPGHDRNMSLRLSGRQTNNRAEIHAARQAIETAKEMGLSKIKLHTDSQFLINGITKWIHSWKRNDWKLSSGEPVKNKEDFQNLDSSLQGIDVQWVHVRGHRGIPGNEAADQLAKEGSCKSL